MKIIAKIFLCSVFFSTTSFADVKITLKNANVISYDDSFIKIVSEGRLFILNKKLSFLNIEKICNSQVDIYESSLLKIKKASKRQSSLKCVKGKK